MEVKETGYLYILTGELEEEIIRNNIHNAVVRYFGEKINYNLFLNIVKNRNNEAQGFTYGWVDNEQVYYFLIGLKPDGKELVEYIEKEVEEVETGPVTLGQDWGSLITPEPEVEKIQLSPILKLSPIVRGDEHLKIIIKPYTTEVNYNLDNSIYSNNIEDWITVKILSKIFEPFNKDKKVYKEKKRTYRYPIIKLKEKKEGKNNCSIFFSPKYPNTASCVINLIKRLKIEEGDKSQLVFFSQSRKRDFY